MLQAFRTLAPYGVKFVTNAKEQYILAYRHLQSGNLKHAEECLRNLIIDYPDHPDVLHLLGIVLKDSGQLEESELLLRKAVEKKPDDAHFHYHYGLSLLKSGMLDNAVEAFSDAVSIDPHLHVARFNLAKALKDCGDLAQSARVYRELLEILPDHEDALYNLANLYYEQDRILEAAGLYQTLLSRQPDYLNARINLALILNKQGRWLEAIQEVEKVLLAKPENSKAINLLRKLNSQLVPRWHIDMLNDTERNDAYDKAISRVAATARHVLEIGTGSGLLAMMAARAGAPKVTTCEMSAPLARIASKIIRKNGYADRVTVVEKKSTRLQVGPDLPEPADVLIAEVFDAGLLGEHFLPALEHARRNLLSENAVIIPAAAKISAVLIECAQLRRVHPIQEIAGFDLSDFDVFRPPGYLQIDLNTIHHQVLSDVIEVSRIDFAKDDPIQTQLTFTIEPTAAGTCQAIVFWFDLYLDQDTIISTRNGTQTNHWKQSLQFFQSDHGVRPGRLINLVCHRTKTGLDFRIEPKLP